MLLAQKHQVPWQYTKVKSPQTGIYNKVGTTEKFMLSVELMAGGEKELTFVSGQDSDSSGLF